MNEIMTPSDVERFWNKVDIRNSNSCWVWRGSTNSSGYGSFRHNSVLYSAHRVSAWIVGLVDTMRCPDDRKASGFVLHRCDNRKCCNPKHFQIGTYTENQKQAYERKRRNAHRGETHINSKLTKEEARRIKQLYATGKYRQVDLAQEYNVSQRVISLIVRGRAYI